MDLDAGSTWVADGNPCSAGYRHVDYSDFLAPEPALNPNQSQMPR